MKYSGIGGQAVMEGVMMKNGTEYAVAVRKPDGGIEVKKWSRKKEDTGLKKMPFIRGVVNFADSLSLGMQTLMYSASFYEEDEGAQKPATKEEADKKKKQDDLLVSGTLVLSVAAAIVIFIMLPYFLSRIFAKYIASQTLLAVIEGVLRLLIFLGYIVLISKMEDIRRIFMYHGAEHKCINCIEHGMELTVQNVRKSSRQHKRCGTSFLFLVVMLSIFFSIFIRSDSAAIRIAARLMLIPVVASISYEFLRLAGRSDHPLVNLLSKPGLALQNMTTREPDDAMIEVGIASVEAVFDWRTFVAEMEDSHSGTDPA